MRSFIEAYPDGDGMRVFGIDIIKSSVRSKSRRPDVCPDTDGGRRYPRRGEVTGFHDSSSYSLKRNRTFLQWTACRR